MDFEALDLLRAFYRSSYNFDGRSILRHAIEYLETGWIIWPSRTLEFWGKEPV